MKLTDEELAALRDGTEGVTVGEWEYYSYEPGEWRVPETLAAMVNANGDKVIDCNWASATEEGARTYRHIARCDPGTIRAIATELLEARAENDRMRGVLDESYSTLAAAFNRIHGLPRTSDTELAKLIETTRAKIERARAALGKGAT